MRGRPILRGLNLSPHFGQVRVAVTDLANGRPTLRLFLAENRNVGWERRNQKTALFTLVACRAERDEVVEAVRVSAPLDRC